MKKEFAETYRTAEWQKKKYEILERDKFTCQLCGNTTRIMEVHHITYKHCYGKAYNALNGELITLCRVCHRGDDGDHCHFGAGRYELRPNKYRPTIIDHGQQSAGRMWLHLGEYRQRLFWTYGLSFNAKELEAVGQRDFKKALADCDEALQVSYPRPDDIAIRLLKLDGKQRKRQK